MDHFSTLGYQPGIAAPAQFEPGGRWPGCSARCRATCPGSGWRRPGRALSRLYRAFELRVTRIEADEVATGFLREGGRRQIRLVANEPDRGDVAEYRDKIPRARRLA